MGSTALMIFGSTHPSVFHMSFCDGHVEGISFDIEPRVAPCVWKSSRWCPSPAEIWP